MGNVELAIEGLEMLFKAMNESKEEFHLAGNVKVLRVWSIRYAIEMLKEQRKRIELLETLLREEREKGKITDGAQNDAT